MLQFMHDSMGWSAHLRTWKSTKLGESGVRGIYGLSCLTYKPLLAYFLPKCRINPVRLRVNYLCLTKTIQKRTLTNINRLTTYEKTALPLLRHFTFYGTYKCLILLHLPALSTICRAVKSPHIATQKNQVGIVGTDRRTIHITAATGAMRGKFLRIRNLSR